MFRRKASPEIAAAASALEAVLDQLEPAKRALVEVVPGTRLPGRPLDDALRTFVAGAELARGLMAAWRRPEVEDAWSACWEGLDRSLGLARITLNGQREPESFVELLEVVQAVLDPLEPFAEAAAALSRVSQLT